MRGLAPYMNSLHAEFGARARFVMVYIHEAHAVDEWPINSARCNGTRGAVCIRAPVSTAERCESAAAFARDFNVRMPMLVDLVEGEEFEKHYAPWPLRFFIVQQGKLQHIASPENSGHYSLQPVREWLLAHCAETRTGTVEASEPVAEWPLSV